MTFKYFIKKFLESAYRPFVVAYLRKDRRYRFRNLNITVHNGVFHPGLFSCVLNCGSVCARHNYRCETGPTSVSRASELTPEIRAATASGRRLRQSQRNGNSCIQPTAAAREPRHPPGYRRNDRHVGPGTWLPRYFHSQRCYSASSIASVPAKSRGRNNGQTGQPGHTHPPADTREFRYPTQS